MNSCLLGPGWPEPRMDVGDENWPAGEMPWAWFTQKSVSSAALKARMAFLHLRSLVCQVPGRLVPTSSTMGVQHGVCARTASRSVWALLIPLFQTKVLKWNNQAASGGLSEEFRRLTNMQSLYRLSSGGGHSLDNLGCRCHEYKIPSEARNPVTGAEREEGRLGFLSQKEGWRDGRHRSDNCLSEPQVWWGWLGEALKAQNACLAKGTHCCKNPAATARSAPNA